MRTARRLETTTASMTSGPERPDAEKGDQKIAGRHGLKWRGIRVVRFPGEQTQWSADLLSRLKRGKIKKLGGGTMRGRANRAGSQYLWAIACTSRRGLARPNTLKGTRAAGKIFAMPRSRPRACSKSEHSEYAE